MQPKTKERMSNFRRANRKMPRRRVDIPVEKIILHQP
jgi:small subunit ribosomal protein S18